jgi:hypothetical protein
MANKQLGIIRKFDRERGFGFVRAAEINYQGRVVPIGIGRLEDHFFSLGFLRRSGISPEAVVEGMPVYFTAEPSRRFEGKTIATNIELVDATDAEAA